jgi:hypothetical protein
VFVFMGFRIPRRLEPIQPGMPQRRKLREIAFRVELPPPHRLLGELEVASHHVGQKHLPAVRAVMGVGALEIDHQPPQHQRALRVVLQKEVGAAGEIGH